MDIMDNPFRRSCTKSKSLNSETIFNMNDGELLMQESSALRAPPPIIKVILWKITWVDFKVHSHPMRIGPVRADFFFITRIAIGLHLLS